MPHSANTAHQKERLYFSKVVFIINPNVTINRKCLSIQSPQNGLEDNFLFHETVPISLEIGIAVRSLNPRLDQPWQASAAVHNVPGKEKLSGLPATDLLRWLAILHEGALTHARTIHRHRRLAPRGTLVYLIVFADARGEATPISTRRTTRGSRSRRWRHGRRRATCPISCGNQRSSRRRSTRSSLDRRILR